MHRPERWPEEETESRSRSSSRRNSASSRRNSLKKDKEVKKLTSAPQSASSTPKKVVKPQTMDFMVTGKQLLKKSDRANSLPGCYHRRPSTDSAAAKKKLPETRRLTNTPQSTQSQEDSLEDDMSLDLSQVSDFEDTNSKYGVQRKFHALATSTPKPSPKPRSASLQSQLHSQRVETRRALKSLESAKQSLNYSRDSTKSSTSYKYGPELDYSSVSPEYSGQSSVDLSPTRASQVDVVATPRSQDLPFSSGCVSSWADVSDPETKVDERRYDRDGEWSSFWANYNNSLSKVPMKYYYDQCPTPYRTEDLDLQDYEFSDTSRKRSPGNLEALNHIIRDQGLQLTPRETQSIIKCAHLLGNVLTKAIDRRSKVTLSGSHPDPVRPAGSEPDPVGKRTNLTLDLLETNVPLEVEEVKKSETVTTQTDISLPNTKSAPRIFENILRQLSKSSIDVGVLGKQEKDVKEKPEPKNDTKDKKIDPSGPKNDPNGTKNDPNCPKNDPNGPKNNPGDVNGTTIEGKDTSNVENGDANVNTKEKDTKDEGKDKDLLQSDDKSETV